MDLTTLKAHIKTGQFNSFYIFTGPEVEVMRIYLNQIAKVHKAGVKNLTRITELGSRLHSRAVLSERSIYVLRDDKDICIDEQLQAKILSERAVVSDIIILIYSNIDKRTKLYKNYQDHIVEFEYLKPDILVKYVQKEISMNEVSCRKLIEICGQDYSRILLEIDKIRQYHKVNPELRIERCFADLVKDKVIYVEPKDAVFDFVDAVLTNRGHDAHALLQESYASGEATLVILYNLYQAAKQTLQVQSYEGSNKITDATGLTPFQVKLASGRKNVYSNGDLVYLMRLTRDVEKKIKTGEIDEAIAVRYILVNFWS